MPFTFSHHAAVIISLLIGITSHILWDALTHQRGIFVEHLEPLRGTVEFAGRINPLYHILQHASTVIGGVAIFYAFLQLPKSKLNEQGSIFRYWFLTH